MAREFWLTIDDPANEDCPVDRGYISNDREMAAAGEVIHVIDKASYDDRGLVIENLKLEIDSLLAREDALAARLAIAVEALEYYEEKRAECQRMLGYDLDMAEQFNMDFTAKNALVKIKE